MAENRYELAKHLARQTILHVFTDIRLTARSALGYKSFSKERTRLSFLISGSECLHFSLFQNILSLKRFLPKI